MLDKLFAIHSNSVKNIPLKTKRYLFDSISWKERAICITGARGVGKTTLLLQHYHEKYASVEKCLYLSADNIHVINYGIFDIAEEYFKYGGEAIIVDEIHKYPEWSREIKNVIDTYKNKKIFISGSSSIALKKGKSDLSRRVTDYDLAGLSFREYLLLEKNFRAGPFKLETLLKNHVKIAETIIKSGPVLKYFNGYLKHGYYPYFLEGKDSFDRKLSNVIEKVISEDIVTIYRVNPVNLPALKKILWLIASSEPFRPNIEKMSRELGISKKYTYLYIEYLENSHLIKSVREKVKGYRLVRKPEKIYVDNTNISCNLLGNLNLFKNEGAARETFFHNQLSTIYPVFTAAKGDFFVDDRYTIEVGGKTKTTAQIRNIKNSYIAADGIEIGARNKIPLYLFGFLY